MPPKRAHRVAYKNIPFQSGDKHSGDAGDEDRLRVSNFHVTMSTNVVMSEAEAASQAPMLEDMLRWLFTDLDNMDDIVDFKYYDDGDYVVDEEMTWDEAPIVEASCVSTVEVGHMARGSRLHMHVAFKVWHRTIISLNREGILERANDYLESHDYPHTVKYLNIAVRGPTAEDYARMGFMNNK